MTISLIITISLAMMIAAAAAAVLCRIKGEWFAGCSGTRFSRSVRAMRARLRNVFAPSKKSGTGWAALALVAVIGLGGCFSLTPQPGGAVSSAVSSSTAPSSIAASSVAASSTEPEPLHLVRSRERMRCTVTWCAYIDRDGILHYAPDFVAEWSQYAPKFFEEVPDGAVKARDICADEWFTVLLENGTVRVLPINDQVWGIGMLEGVSRVPEDLTKSPNGQVARMVESWTDVQYLDWNTDDREMGTLYSYYKWPYALTGPSKSQIAACVPTAAQVKSIAYPFGLKEPGYRMNILAPDETGLQWDRVIQRTMAYRSTDESNYTEWVTIALYDDGTVHASNDAVDARISRLTDVVQLAITDFSLAALRSDGTIDVIFLSAGRAPAVRIPDEWRTGVTQLFCAPGRGELNYIQKSTGEIYDVIERRSIGVYEQLDQWAGIPLTQSGKVLWPDNFRNGAWLASLSDIQTITQ